MRETLQVTEHVESRGSGVFYTCAGSRSQIPDISGISVLTRQLIAPNHDLNKLFVGLEQVALYVVHITMIGMERVDYVNTTILGKG